MKAWWMTLLGMMGLVAVCAVWSVWLIRPTFHAASFAFTTMWTVLLVGLLQLRYGRNRAFWFGFVVFGWGYALLAFAPGSWMEIRPYLLTTHPVGDLADLLGHTKPKMVTDLRTAEIVALTTDYHIVMEAGLNHWFATVPGDRFQRVAHSLAAILHGVAGGILAVFLERRARAVPAPTPDP